MKMEYILIKKNNINKHKNKDENVIIIPSSPLMLIEKNFEEVKVNKISNKDEEMFRSHWDGTFSINESKIIFSIKQYSKQKLSYLNINAKINNVHNMELIDEKVNNIIGNNYIVITSYDCISEFYCNKIYRKLNNFERKLKELLFDIYTFHYGINYYDRNFSANLKSKVKTDKSIYSESISIEKIKQALYELDYNGIIELLFTPKWLVDDEKDKLNLMEKINDNSLPSKELIDCIDNIRPKSDWDRLFLPQIGEVPNIEDSINQLRILRNSIAHCKFFRKEHYEECLNLLKILNKQINKALKIVMNIDFQELNVQYVSDELHKALETFQESLTAISRSISNMMTESFKQITSAVTTPITDMLKKFKENWTIPLINYRNTDYNYKKIKGLKKLENKKFIRKSNKT
ncbi:MAG: hypothetical protein HFJ30_07755 [Clostridia bacterium]|nr:hypothetical protein [Clostridia bacterium]